MSTLKVNEIQHTNGTTALTLDTSGNIVESNLALSFWIKTNDTETVGTSVTTIDDWTEVNGSYGFNRIGGAFTVSSGVFTFPSTGVWKATAHWFFNSQDASRYIGGKLNFNGDNMTQYTHIMDSGSDGVYAHLSTERYCNVTNTGSQTLYLQVESGVNIQVRGGFSGGTSVAFQRIAPPQS